MSNMNNPIELLKMIRNPQEYVINMANTNSNPMLQKLVEMAKNGDSQGVEQFARNLLKEQGQDLDQIMALFK